MWLLLTDKEKFFAEAKRLVGADELAVQSEELKAIVERNNAMADERDRAVRLAQDIHRIAQAAHELLSAGRIDDASAILRKIVAKDV